jgi:hypothetical protein
VTALALVPPSSAAELVVPPEAGEELTPVLDVGEEVPVPADGLSALGAGEVVADADSPALGSASTSSSLALAASFPASDTGSTRSSGSTSDVPILQAEKQNNAEITHALLFIASPSCRDFQRRCSHHC